uniref:Uncharacterized protein n=1 Tax=Magallana gigas TaxID=29159 RepID=K1QUS5_MAGGI|nr:uncharacterized protein LOC105326420 [Crassostrea gigas]|eukprot:XP_011424757.1 PREDICTED: uncharacterized protein LOC105326420 [Crassostrea gigas]
MSSRWDWMLGIIFMVAISVIVIVATFACIVFCKCKKKLKQAKTVGIEPTATDDDTDVELRPVSPSDIGRGRKKTTPVTPLHTHRSSTITTPIGSSRQSNDHFFYSSRQAWMFEPD